MGLDIRLPIGFLFSILGVLLVGFGVISDKAIYDRSLGLNVNLSWGVVLLVFGIFMAFFGHRRSAMRLQAPSGGGSSHNKRGGHGL